MCSRGPVSPRANRSPGLRKSFWLESGSGVSTPARPPPGLSTSYARAWATAPLKPRSDRRQADEARREYPRRAAERLRIAVRIDRAVSAHQPIAVSGCRHRHPGDRLTEQEAVGAPEERRIAEGEDPTVAGHQPVPVT